MKGLRTVIFLLFALALVLLPRPGLAAPGDIFTVAGGGVGDNGAATAAALHNPEGVAVDSAGNLYIADQLNNRIRKVTAGTGIITTVAGNETGGFSGDNGPATAASLSSPTGVAVDSAGNIYIADLSNQRIRKVTAGTGVITTVAGTGTAAYSGDDGAATASSLYNPNCVAVDSTGNLYIADTGSQRIRKVTAGTGIITTVAGTGTAGYSGDDGPATAARLHDPVGIAVDSTGDLYIADYYNNRIRKVAAATGIITAVAGSGTPGYSGDNGPATAANLYSPTGVAVDIARNLYIATYNDQHIRKVTAATGIIITVAGTGTAGYSGDNGPATAATLNNPAAVAVDSAGNLYIADELNQRARKVAAGTGVITTVAGNGSWSYSGDNGPATAASLSSPADVAVDSAGNLYIADSYNNRIRKVAAGTGIITTVAGNGAPGYSGDNGPATAASLSGPTDVALDSAGNLYITDYFNNRIRKVAAGTGIITTVAGSGTAGYSGDNGPATAASLNGPFSVALDNAENLYATDTGNQRIRKVAAGSGIITTVAGNGSQGYSGDNGPATVASLNNPSGVAIDGSGNLYLSDAGNQRIRKVAAGSGIISTVAGNGAFGFSGDNVAATATSLNSPAGVALDSAGNLYIADSNNNRIRKVDVGTGIITTVAGNGSYGYTGDTGAASAARLARPSGISMDGAGNLYIADNYNNRIRKVMGSIIPVVIASPDGGTYISALDVILISSKPATIYYTTDGSNPTTSGTRKSFVTSGQLTIWSNTTLKYYAVDTDGHVSDVATRSYTIINQSFFLNLTIAGTGSGSVHSSPAGIACSTGPTGTCTALFDQGLQVTLMVSPSAGSVFAGWTGDCSNGSGDCKPTMDANKNVTSTFTYFPIRIYGSPVDYTSLQSAHNAAITNDVIQAQAAILVENPILDKPTAVTIKGGYDTDFNVVSGITTLQGTLTLKNGTVTVDGLMVR
jgi:hypothetical protein